MKHMPRTLLQLAALAVVFLAGWLIGQPSPDQHVDEAPPTASEAEDADSGSLDSTESRGSAGTAEAEGEDTDDTSDERSREGAIAAAIRFLELTEEAVELSPTDAGDLQRSISTEASAERLAGDVESTLTEVAVSVPEGVVVHAAPLGTSAREVGDGWEVSIWYVEVVIYGTELAVEQWSTATYTLVWESNEWRMANLVSVDGPVPVRTAATVASSVSELTAATSGLSDEGWGQ